MVSHLIYRIPLLQLLSLSNLSAASFSSLPLLASHTQRKWEVEVVEEEGGEGRHKGLGAVRRARVRGWMGGNRGSKGGPCVSRGLGGGEKPERQKGKTGAGEKDEENWWEGRVQG